MITRVDAPEVKGLYAQCDNAQVIQGAQNAPIDSAQSQSLINLEPAIEQRLIDLAFDVSPVDTGDMMQDQMELLQPQAM